MNAVKTTTKPFGLSLAVKIAREAIRENIAPSSVVFSNLFHLKNSSSFPTDLDKYFFANTKNQVNETEKKAISKLLDSIKRPQVDVQELLETVMADGWVKKVPPKPVKPVAKKTVAVKKTNKSTAPKKAVVVPTITVKKTRLI